MYVCPRKTVVFARTFCDMAQFDKGCIMTD